MAKFTVTPHEEIPIPSEKFPIMSVRQMFPLMDKFPSAHGMDWMYRGQADFEWLVLPKAGRDEYHDPNWRTVDVEKGVKRPPKDLGRFNDWRSQAIAYCSDLPSDDYECLAYAQHHGLATRLLDWTTNPFVALYFAVRERQGRDGAFYAYSNGTIIVPEKLPLEKVPKVAVYLPRPVHARILVQRGMFTVHPEPHVPLVGKPMEENAVQHGKSELDVVKIKIDGESKSMIQRELYEMGIDESVLFPGVEGLSEFVNWETRRSVAYSRGKLSVPDDLDSQNH